MKYPWNEQNVGDTFVFGRYAPAGCDQKLPVTWQILKKQEGRMLVLSEKILDIQPYHRDKNPVRWENSDLRKWLNTVFWNAAFTEEEQRQVCPPMHVEDPIDDFLWEMFGLETATDSIADSVFLLSQADIQTCFPGEDPFYPGAEAEETACVQALGGCGQCWWLRSSMTSWPAAMIVSPCASIGMSMFHAEQGQGIRPAMWVKRKKA